MGSRTTALGAGFPSKLGIDWNAARLIMAPGLPGNLDEAANGRDSAGCRRTIQARLPESRCGFDGVEEEDVMFDDEKLAAHQETLDEHNYDQGWAVHGPAVQKPKPVTEKAGPAPG